MTVEASRCVVVSTKFSHRPFILNNNNIDDNENNDDEDVNPRFTVKASVYDFWNLVET